MLTIYDATWSNIRSASSYANVYTYTGRQLDTETGLYYYRARCCTPSWGGVSRDSRGVQSGSQPSSTCRTLRQVKSIRPGCR